MRNDRFLENAFDDGAEIALEKRMMFTRTEQSLESLEECETENTREPKSFKRSSSTASERTIDSLGHVIEQQLDQERL
jgi:hypothetical protein